MQENLTAANDDESTEEFLSESMEEAVIPFSAKMFVENRQDDHNEIYNTKISNISKRNDKVETCTNKVHLKEKIKLYFEEQRNKAYSDIINPLSSRVAFKASMKYEDYKKYKNSIDRKLKKLNQPLQETISTVIEETENVSGNNNKETPQVSEVSKPVSNYNSLHSPLETVQNVENVNAQNTNVTNENLGIEHQNSPSQSENDSSKRSEISFRRNVKCNPTKAQISFDYDSGIFYCTKTRQSFTLPMLIERSFIDRRPKLKIFDNPLKLINPFGPRKTHFTNYPFASSEEREAIARNQFGRQNTREELSKQNSKSNPGQQSFNLSVTSEEQINEEKEQIEEYLQNPDSRSVLPLPDKIEEQIRRHLENKKKELELKIIKSVKSNVVYSDNEDDYCLSEEGRINYKGTRRPEFLYENKPKQKIMPRTNSLVSHELMQLMIKKARQRKLAKEQLMEKKKKFPLSSPIAQFLIKTDNPTECTQTSSQSATYCNRQPNKHSAQMRKSAPPLNQIDDDLTDEEEWSTMDEEVNKRVSQLEKMLERLAKLRERRCEPNKLDRGKCLFKRMY